MIVFVIQWVHVLLGMFWFGGTMYLNFIHFEKGFFPTSNGSSLLLSHYLYLLATIFFFGFFGYACVLLRMAEGEPYTLSRIVFGATVATASLFLLSSVISQALVARAATGTGSVAIGLLSDITTLSLIASGIPVIILVTAASVVILRTKFLSYWLGLSGLLLSALLLLASSGFLLPTGPLAAGGIFTMFVFAGFEVWELALSIVLVARTLATWPAVQFGREPA